MSRRSLANRMATQSCGDGGEQTDNSDVGDVDVNEMVEGLINSLEEDRTNDRMMNVPVEDVYSYSPSPGFADDPDQLLEVANYHNHRRRSEGNTYYRRKCLLRTMIVIAFISSVVLAILWIAAAMSSNNSATSSTTNPSSPAATTTNYNIPTPPDDIFIWCSQDYINAQGNSNTCQRICQLAACCFSTDDESCSSQNPEACARYTVCLAMEMPPPDNTTVNVVIDSVGEANNQTTSSTSETFLPHKIGPAPIDQLSADCNSNMALDACYETCFAALCCFDASAEKNCYSYSNNYISCNDYSKYCIILGGQFAGKPPVDSNTVDQIGNATTPIVNETNNNGNQLNNTVILMSPPDQLEKDCLKLSQMQEGDKGDELNICRSTCSDGSCCFSEGADNCRAHNQDICVQYDICILTGIAFMSSSIPNPPSNLSDVCSEQSIQDSNAYHVCSKICASATCCLAKSEICINVDKSQCSSYQSCLNLLKTANPESGDLQLNSTTPEVLPSNSTTPEDLTPDYNATTVVPVEPPPENLASKCQHALTQPFTTSLDECQNACSQSTCCVDSVKETNCYGLNADVCQMYSPCHTIDQAYLNLTSSEPTNLLAPPEGLQTRCAGIINEGQLDRSSCWEACATATCCISSTENCFTANAGVCESFKVCFILPDVAKACSESNLADPSSQKNCQDLCAAKMCCFAPSPDENCQQGNWSECIPYAPCSNLNMLVK